MSLPPLRSSSASLPFSPSSASLLFPILLCFSPLVPQDAEPPSGIDLVRCIAAARILMPATVVRLSAGRLDLTPADQALAFLAGANSIFDGDKLLTTPNNDRNEDAKMFEMLGLRSRPAFLPYASGGDSSRAFGEAVGGVAAAAAESGGGGGCCGGGCGSGSGAEGQEEGRRAAVAAC